MAKESTFWTLFILQSHPMWFRASRRRSIKQLHQLLPIAQYEPITWFQQEFSGRISHHLMLHSPDFKFLFLEKEWGYSTTPAGKHCQEDDSNKCSCPGRSPKDYCVKLREVLCKSTTQKWRAFLQDKTPAAAKALCETWCPQSTWMTELSP